MQNGKEIKNQRGFYITDSGSGSTIIRPDITTTTSEPVGALPHQMGSGFSWNRTDKYMLAVDFSTALWSRVPNIFAADGVGLRDTYNVGAGMEISIEGRVL